jgi:hypothetical protein
MWLKELDANICRYLRVMKALLPLHGQCIVTSVNNIITEHDANLINVSGE